MRTAVGQGIRIVRSALVVVGATGRVAREAIVGPIVSVVIGPYTVDLGVTRTVLAPVGVGVARILVAVRIGHRDKPEFHVVDLLGQLGVFAVALEKSLDRGSYGAVGRPILL